MTPNFGSWNPKSLEPEQLDSLLAAVEAGPNGTRNRLAFLVCFNHALRVSELVSLRPEDISLGQIQFTSGKSKLRIVHPLADDEREAVEKLAAERKGQESLFTIKAAMFDRIIKQAGERAGIHRSLCHMHTLRHSCARYLARKRGVPLEEVQQWLGHKSLAVTSVYLNPSPGEVANSVMKALNGGL